MRDYGRGALDMYPFFLRPGRRAALGLLGLAAIARHSWYYCFSLIPAHVTRINWIDYDPSHGGRLPARCTPLGWNGISVELAGDRTEGIPTIDNPVIHLCNPVSLAVQDFKEAGLCAFTLAVFQFARHVFIAIGYRARAKH